MRRYFTTLLPTLFALFLLSVPASAGPIVWTLSGVTFDDGGIATGSFVYDADLNQYSSVNITTTAGGTLSGATYITVNSNFSPFTGSFLTTAVDPIGLPTLYLQFLSPLTNAGGTSSIATASNNSFEGPCAASDCLSAGPPLRLVQSGGTVMAVAAVPEPATVVFSGAGILFIAVLCARRRLAQS